VKQVGVILAVALAAVAVTHSALAAGPRQTKQRAERNLLSATRVIARWHVGLVNPKSGLVRQNTTAACRGAGAGTARGYSSFTCVVKHARTVVRVRYVALRRNGFELHRLHSRG